ncbi:LPXTG cell wall anchor domain-containing protein [Microbacterium sp. LWH12-1.2]|uniref:LPXTG cell wall anchor domain-containing protein n=1 Tax=Microbacterium sp. LWH12-1.2 TaxID=3135259 RepID=UPI00341D37BD
MRGRCAAAVAALAGCVAIAVLGTFSAPAWAAPATEVVQGQYLRLVSVADWEAASSMMPGQEVRWDVEVSADAPDPGKIAIGMSAAGAAPLTVDVSICAVAWEEMGCPVGATALETAWEIPRDGITTALLDIAATDTAYLRLEISLGAAAEGEGATMRVHADGAGESVAVGPGGELPATGMSPAVPWILGGGVVLLLVGGVLLFARRRRRGDGDEGAAE